MHSFSHHADEAGKASVPIYVEQLHHLAQSLPPYIEHTVLPHLSTEVESCAAELSTQVDGTRQLLLQSAVLRRSAVLAPLLKQQLLRSAGQLQRRRAQLLQLLQRQERQWRAAATRFSSGRSTPANANTETPSELQVVLSALEAATRGEERCTSVVHAPLRPSTPTLRAFLADAVTRLKLHRRVRAQVEDPSSSPEERSSPLPRKKSGNAGASMQQSLGLAATGGASSSSASSPLPEGVMENGDAIEAALHLLLHHLKYDGSPQSAVASGLTTRSRTKRTPSNGSGVADTTSFRPASPSAQASDAGVCHVDVDSDVDVDDLSQLAAEEDAVLLVDPTAQQRQYEPQDSATQRHADSSLSPSSSGPWLRVPGIVSLEEYCSDLPWVAELAEQRYDEARERKKHSGGSSSSGTGGEAGYFSRHVQPEERDAKEKNLTHKAPSQPVMLISSLPPLGCFFSPALAAGAPASASTSSRAESAMARAGSRASTTTTAAAAAADHSRPVGSPTSEKEMLLQGGEGQTGDRGSLARAVVRCIAPAVDEAWQDVEETVLLPFCAASAKALPIAAANNGSAANTIAEEEEEAISAFLEVVRVRYAVELAARVVAARQAVELLLDSEDSVIFDGARLLALSLRFTDAGDSSKAEQGAAAAAAAAREVTPAPSSSSASVLTCTVLTLPGLEEMFYVVAYCVGAALLREAANATYTRAGRSGRSGPQRERLVIDVDAEDTAGEGEMPHRTIGMADEEDVGAQQQAALRVWATEFERRYLASSLSLGSGASRPAQPLASHFRLWLYLWEFVFTLAPSPSSGAAADGGEEEGDARAHQRPSGKGKASGALIELFVSLRTARRWIERVMEAALRRGGGQSGVLTFVSSAPPPLELCLPSFWTSAERERVVRLTSAQARQALLRAAGVDNLT